MFVELTKEEKYCTSKFFVRDSSEVRCDSAITSSMLPLEEARKCYFCSVIQLQRGSLMEAQQRAILSALRAAPSHSQALRSNPSAPIYPPPSTPLMHYAEHGRAVLSGPHGKRNNLVNLAFDATTLINQVSTLISFPPETVATSILLAVLRAVQVRILLSLDYSTRELRGVRRRCLVREMHGAVWRNAVPSTSTSSKIPSAIERPFRKTYGRTSPTSRGIFTVYDRRPS